MSGLTFTEVNDAPESDIRIFEHVEKPDGKGTGNLALMHTQNISTNDPYAGDMRIGKDLATFTKGDTNPLDSAQLTIGIASFFNAQGKDNYVEGIPTFYAAGRITTSIADDSESVFYGYGVYPKYEYDGLLAVDIVRVQSMYGVNLDTGAGNTRYDISPTLEGHKYQAIWDGNGVDTLTFERETADTVVNLGAGIDTTDNIRPSGTLEYKEAKQVRLAEQINNGNALDNVLAESAATTAGAGVDTVLIAASTALAAQNSKLQINGAATDAELAFDGNALYQAVGNQALDVTYKFQIAALYKVMLGRSEADTAGMQYWIGQYEAGVSIKGIADSFGSTVLNKTIYSFNDQTFAGEVYRMALGREATEAEASSIVSSLANGADRSDVFLSILNSAEFKANFYADIVLRVAQTIEGSDQNYVEPDMIPANFVDSSEVQIAWGTVIENGSGGLGDDIVTGNDFNNVLSPGAMGDDTIDGRDGVDTLRFYENKSMYDLTLDGNGGVIAKSIYGTVTATNMEQIAFNDGIYRMDGQNLVRLDDEIGQIVRLYHGIFDRDTIDTGGLNYWKDKMDAGDSLVGVANSMMAHGYYHDVHNTGSNEAFVDSAFNIALDRGANQSERQFWIDQLNSGNETQASVMVALTESEESRLNQIENTIFHSAVVGTGDASQTQFGVNDVELADFGISITQPEYFF